MRREAKTRLVTVFVLVAVFGTGVLLGLAADFSLDAEAAEVVAEGSEATETERPRRRRFYEQVGATEAQLASIEAIVAEHRARTTALDEQHRAELRMGFREILLETREAIKAVLTPEQAAEYQELADEWDAAQAARREAERENGDEKG